MKNFGKGVALFVVIIAIATALKILFGVESGSLQESIAFALGCVLCFPVAVKYDAVKPFLILNSGMGAILLLDCVLFFSTGIAILEYMLPLIGNMISIVLAIHRIRKNK